MRAEIKHDGDKSGRIARLHSWLDNDVAPGGDLEETLREQHEVRRLFLAELADRLQDPVNRHLTTLPQANGKEKSWLSSTLNALLASFDLGVKDPKSGSVGILSVAGAHKDTAGQFRINVPSAGTRTGRTHHTAFTELRVLEFGPRQDHDSRRPWTDLIRRDSRGHERG